MHQTGREGGERASLTLCCRSVAGVRGGTHKRHRGHFSGAVVAAGRGTGEVCEMTPKISGMRVGRRRRKKMMMMTKGCEILGR
jgi:hypothetical protein